MKERKPDAYTRRFIEWSKLHNCPVMYKYDDDANWKPMLTNKFNWNTCNYKIDDWHYKNYYEKLYKHGTN